MTIPMVDLKAEYRLLKEDIDRALIDVAESGHYILGPNVAALEQEIAAYCGVRHAVALASGTDALHLALRAAGVGAGDEVITTPFTFIATAEAISYIGATPVFVDVRPDTFNIDPALIEPAITARTRAVLPVHLFGQPADLAPIAELCRRHGLRLIEDCAQSFGAEYGGKRCGAHGDAGCFSFYPSKNLGAFGDAGMLVTDDDHIAAAARMYRDHGSQRRYHHSVIGYNSRLDELQAAVLRVKLKHVEHFNRLRREHAARYKARLGGLDLTLPVEDGKGLHVYHQFTIRSRRRDAIQQALAEARSASAIYYPVPLHRQEVYSALCQGLSLPEAEAAAAEVLSLPMSPLLQPEQLDAVCTAIVRALS